ncbi:unnamed protein product [Adineta ricciae]|uniref:Uncharacterized protein n=1 Tax=Adineta ricciae TaxID=249248 RepID=A0A814I8R6_ADIRI|nr:unnamed protein product [Adineta ricciae]CAF1019907.1 unnamed protein product [Adineta ricciae]
MTIRSMSGGNRRSKTNTKNSELFTLVWLHTPVQESLKTEDKVRSIINELEQFQDATENGEHIEQKSSQDRLFVIVSDQLERQSVPCIRHYHQVISIYVYCLDKTINEEWMHRYWKVNQRRTEVF